jgi:hypothetical protein
VSWWDPCWEFRAKPRQAWPFAWVPRRGTRGNRVRNMVYFNDLKSALNAIKLLKLLSYNRFI